MASRAFHFLWKTKLTHKHARRENYALRENSTVLQRRTFLRDPTGGKMISAGSPDWGHWLGSAQLRRGPCAEPPNRRALPPRAISNRNCYGAMSREYGFKKPTRLFPGSSADGPQAHAQGKWSR